MVLLVASLMEPGRLWTEDLFMMMGLPYGSLVVLWPEW